MGDMNMIRKGLIAFILLAIFLVGCNTDKDEAEKTFQVSGSSEEADEETNKESNDDESVVDTENDTIILPDEELQKLSEGESVNNLQQALIALGYPLEVTGVYDEKTTWAITDLQLQEDSLYINGIYNQEMKEHMEERLENNQIVEEPFVLEEPNEPDVQTEIVENPYEVLSVVNKSFSLPSDYEPEDLTVPEVSFPFTEDDPKKQLRKEAAHALEDLFAGAEQVGIHLFAQSGYRSYDRQEAIFAANVEQDGEEHANTYSARPGESEHQTGLVMDVTAESVGFNLNTDFGETDEGKWVEENAHEYGFIIRYPDGKEEITKYQYEPWHLRYVGVKAATEIKNNEQTLEEYLSVH